jgi:hypothetical protein
MQQQLEQRDLIDIFALISSRALTVTADQNDRLFELRHKLRTFIEAQQAAQQQQEQPKPE